MTWQDIARRQHGVIRHDQLLQAGLSRHDVAVLRRSGRVVNAGARGVLRARAAPRTVTSTWWAAVLASRGVLSHSTAARLWRIAPAPAPSTRIHVTIPRHRQVTGLAGVHVHRLALTPATVRHVDDLPVTDRATTVLDCLATQPRADAMDLFDRALQQDWIDLHTVARRIDGAPGRPGNRTLRWLLAEASLGDARSERLLHSILRHAGIGGWRPNVQLGRFVGDVVFTDARLVVEVDGFAHHVTRDKFLADRAKQNFLVADGWAVLRFTWNDLVHRPAYVAETIVRLVDRTRS